MKTLTRGHFKAGLDSVRSTKLRSFWTMLGVIIGVTSVITVVAIGEGVKQQINGQIHHMGKDLITIRPTQLQTGDGAGHVNSSLLSGLSITSPLTSKDVTIVQHAKGVSAAAPLTVVTGTPKGENGSYNDGYVIGTTSDLSGLLNQSVAYGAFLTDDDVGTNSAIVGSHAATALFNEEVPLGRSFTFHGQEFIVKGVFNEFNSTPLSQQADFNNAIFIPYDVAGSLSKGTAPTYEVLAKSRNASETSATAKHLRQALDQAHGGQSNFSILSGEQNVTSSSAVLDLLTRLIAGVAAISLLVGGIGIMNVMLVSVAERTHEIGIRKAVGATNRQILNQFMVESTLLSLTGGVIGILLAYAIDGLLRLFTPIRPAITWEVVVVATGVALAVGIIFGSVPALKAARKDPIEALRAE